ncbi:MAG: hypothetical protein IJ391_03885 [Clostridia bacterium]|nr:hypothetical protein [Clostridia bacterium]
MEYKSISVRIDNDLLCKLKYIAKQNHLTVSALLRLLMQSEVDSFKKQHGDIIHDTFDNV